MGMAENVFSSQKISSKLKVSVLEATDHSKLIPLKTFLKKKEFLQKFSFWKIKVLKFFADVDSHCIFVLQSKSLTNGCTISASAKANYVPMPRGPDVIDLIDKNP